MHDVASGINVEIKKYGSGDQYREWEAPRSSRFYARDRNEVFIESANGESFFVEIHDITSNWLKAVDLHVSVRMDGAPLKVANMPEKSGPQLKEKEPQTASLIHDTYFESVKGPRTVHGFPFKGTAVGKTKSPSAFQHMQSLMCRTGGDPTLLFKDEKAIDHSPLGWIKVTVQRGKATLRRKSKEEGMQEALRLRDPTVLSVGTTRELATKPSLPVSAAYVGLSSSLPLAPQLTRTDQQHPAKVHNPASPTPRLRHGSNFEAVGEPSMSGSSGTPQRVSVAHVRSLLAEWH